MKQLLITIAALVLVGCGNSEANQALLDAAEFGNIEAAKEAIEDGADVNAKDVIYGTPLDNVGRFYDAATKAKEANLANLLRKHGGKTGEELEAAGN